MQWLFYSWAGICVTTKTWPAQALRKLRAALQARGSQFGEVNAVCFRRSAVTRTLLCQMPCPAVWPLVENSCENLICSAGIGGDGSSFD